MSPPLSAHPSPEIPPEISAEIPAQAQTQVIETRPYPLMGRFRRYILPTLALLLVTSVMLTVWGGRELVEAVYLQVAQQRADFIVRAAERRAPESWSRLTRLTGADAVPSPADLADFQQAIDNALVDSRVKKLKIYDSGGRMIFNTEGKDLGSIERGPALSRLLESGEPQILFKEGSEGALYELYVWLPDAAGNIQIVLELYEPVEYLDALMVTNLTAQVALPAALVLGLTVILWRILSLAQADIDLRQRALASLHDRLSRLLSSHAVGAAQRAVADGGFRSTVMDAALFYSDVRNFTSFCEDAPPRDVVAFLNRVMTIQIRLIQDHGGDVDKMIGDAVLAVFEGPDRTAKAIACAQAIQTRMAKEQDLPRAIGIGVHDGHVISGVVGPEERQDFTVVGDAVNVAARMCSLAGAGEVYADAVTLARAGHPDGFTAAEDVQVKGREEPLRVRRWVV